MDGQVLWTEFDNCLEWRDWIMYGMDRYKLSRYGDLIRLIRNRVNVISVDKAGNITLTSYSITDNQRYFVNELIAPFSIATYDCNWWLFKGRNRITQLRDGLTILSDRTTTFYTHTVSLPDHSILWLRELPAQPIVISKHEDLHSEDEGDIERSLDIPFDPAAIRPENIPSADCMLERLRNYSTLRGVSRGEFNRI